MKDAMIIVLQTPVDSVKGLSNKKRGLSPQKRLKQQTIKGLSNANTMCKTMRARSKALKLIAKL